MWAVILLKDKRYAAAFKQFLQNMSAALTKLLKEMLSFFMADILVTC